MSGQRIGERIDRRDPDNSSLLHAANRLGVPRTGEIGKEFSGDVDVGDLVPVRGESRGTNGNLNVVKHPKSQSPGIEDGCLDPGGQGRRRRQRPAEAVTSDVNETGAIQRLGGQRQIGRKLVLVRQETRPLVDIGDPIVGDDLASPEGQDHLSGTICFPEQSRRKTARGIFQYQAGNF